MSGFINITPGTVLPIASPSQKGADDNEQQTWEHCYVEGAEYVNQHVRVTVLPEHSTQHLRRVKPNIQGLSNNLKQNTEKWFLL